MATRYTTVSGPVITGIKEPSAVGTEICVIIRLPYEKNVYSIKSDKWDMSPSEFVSNMLAIASIVYGPELVQDVVNALAKCDCEEREATKEQIEREIQHETDLANTIIPVDRGLTPTEQWSKKHSWPIEDDEEIEIAY